MRNSKKTVRLPLEQRLLILIENWRRSQEKIPSRTDAVRQLLKRALKESEHAAA